MDRTNNLTCPSCHAPLKSERGIRIGKKITCPKCKIGFTVRLEAAEQAALAAGANKGRLAIVLAGALLCFARRRGVGGLLLENNVVTAERAKVESSNNDIAATSVSAKASTVPKTSRA